MVLGEEKTIPTVTYLMESGLLFEINRLILNPIGLHLGVETDEDGSNPRFAELVDATADAEGIVLGNRDILRGSKLVSDTFEEFESRRQRRLQALGYIIQELPDMGLPSVPTNQVPQANKSEEVEIDERLKNAPKKVHTTGAAEDIAKTSNIVKSQQDVDTKVPRSVLSSKLTLTPSARSGDCPHPDANLVKSSISGGGSVTFCSLCGTQFKDSDLVQ